MIQDLGIIMITAAVTSLVCKFLKQPVVLGYIVAGLLVGPYAFGEAWVNDEHSVETWGQVGVIFLLFSLGLEFSFKKLVQLGSTAIVGCLTIVVGMMTTGFLVGRLLGWDEMNSLFLGGMLCMSSTTIVFKALDDLGLRQQKFANICFGILVVEDLFAVVLMVLLASIAVKQTFDGEEMFTQIVALVAYLLFWFVSGIMLIPTLLRICRKHLNEETMVIVALGLCLGMVLLAEGAGFSAALGAFVMGSILAETVEAERIEHLIAPIKNMFGAVFFVSVGMMIDPQMLLDFWLPITIITLVVIVGQIVFASLGVVLSGQPLRTAMQSAFALTQVGEFAFIIANFGASKGLTEPWLYPVIVAVSVITTFLTPYTIRLAQPAYERLNLVMPERFKLWLESYAAARNLTTDDSLWGALLKKVVLTLAIWTVSAIFVGSLYFSFLHPLVVSLIAAPLPSHLEWIGRMVSLLIVLLAGAPVIYNIATKHLFCTEVRALWNGGSFRRGGIVLLALVRLVLCLVLLTTAISQVFTATYGILVSAALLVVALVLMSRKVRRQSLLIEQRFHGNLTAREAAQESRRIVRREFEDALAGYDLSVADFGLPLASAFCGKTLQALDFRRQAGISVVRVVRGDEVYNIPGGSFQLFPSDRIVVAGTDAQIQRFGEMLQSSLHTAANGEGETPDHGAKSSARVPISLQQFVVTDLMPFCGLSLNESRLGQKAQCVVLRVQRGNEVIEPDAHLHLIAGDVVVLAGEVPKIRQLIGG